VSFVLKRLLGHLFKPDQLDLSQIDSQIGSGFVQVKDLRLDNEVLSDPTSLYQPF
jgi:autophagy-related protein 2